MNMVLKMRNTKLKFQVDLPMSTLKHIIIYQQLTYI